MIETIDKSLEIGVILCKSLIEAEEQGESMCGKTYHILMKTKKKIIIINKIGG